VKCFYDNQQGISGSALLKTFPWLRIDRTLLACQRARLGDHLLYADVETRGESHWIVAEKDDHDERALVFHTSIDLIDQTRQLVHSAGLETGWAVDLKILTRDIETRTDTYPGKKEMMRVKTTSVIVLKPHVPFEMVTEVFEFEPDYYFGTRGEPDKMLFWKRTTKFEYDGSVVKVRGQIEDLELEQRARQPGWNGIDNRTGKDKWAAS